MKRKMMLILAGLLAAAPAFSSSASQAANSRADVVLQAGTKKEMIDGDLNGAIELYRQAVRAAGKDRPLAAKALLRIASCQERQGVNEAKKTYQEIVRDYSDQKEAVSFARLKLGEGGAAPGTVRKLYDGLDMGNSGSVSPDGRSITYTHWGSGDIRIFDVASGESRTLFSRGGWEKSGGDYGMNSLFSPDGREIVFSWFRALGGASLKIVTPAGGNPRTVGADSENFGAVTGWHPDGRHVVTVLAGTWGQSERTILLVDITDGSKQEVVRVPAAFSAQMNIHALASPDGKFIVYDRRRSADDRASDIYVVPAAGGEGRPLIADPSNDWIIAWSPDGSRLVFGSNRGNTPGMYMAGFRDGQIVGEPELLKERPARFPLGFDQNGNYYYNETSGSILTLRVAPFDPSAGKATGPMKTVPVRRGMDWTQHPIWLPEHGMLAFQRRAGEGEDAGTEFVIADPDTGTESRVLKTTLNFPLGMRFRPDGTAVVKDIGSAPLENLNVKWENDSLEPLRLADSLEKGHLCTGPHIRLQGGKDGVFVSDYASNVRWRLTEANLVAGSAFVVSGDCSQIVYRANPGRAIRIRDLATGSERDLVALDPPYTVGLSITLTPDGRRLLFTRMKSEREAAELMSVPVTGGAPTPAGITIHGLASLALSPDGRRLAFTGGQVSQQVYMEEGLLPPAYRKAR